MKTFVKKLDVIFAFVLTFIYELGSVVYYDRHFCIKDLAMSIFLIVCLAFALPVLNFIVSYLKKVQVDKIFCGKIFSAYGLIFACFALLLVYFICFVSYYPGIAAYDIYSSFLQVKNNVYNNQQPVMYTFLVKFILAIVKNDYTKMLVVYSISQILFVLAVCFYLLVWMFKNNVNKLIVIGSYFYFLFVPVLHIFVMITTKDVLFSCLFLLLAISYIDLIRNFNLKKACWFVAYIVLSCLFRNNMMYAVTLFLFVFLGLIFYQIFTSSKIAQLNQKVCLCIFAGLGIFAFIQILFYTVFNVYMTPVGEKLCVPINQICHVYVNEKLSADEKQKIIYFIPDAKKYNPRFVDPVKASFNTRAYFYDKKSFWKLYFELFKRYPNDYVKSFLNLNIPYWFIGAKFPDEYSKREYIETWYNLDSKEIPQLSALEKRNQRRFVNNYYESFAKFNNPIVHVFPFNLYFSLAFSFLSLIICVYLCLKQKMYNLIGVYLLFLSLFATFILGPVSIFRYVYTFYLTLPFYFGILFGEHE